MIYLEKYFYIVTFVFSLNIVIFDINKHTLYIKLVGHMVFEEKVS